MCTYIHMYIHIFIYIYDSFHWKSYFFRSTQYRNSDFRYLVVQIQSEILVQKSHFGFVCIEKCPMSRMALVLPVCLKKIPRYLAVQNQIGCLGRRPISNRTVLSRRSFSTKEPLIIRLFCGKWPIKIRHSMDLRHPVWADVRSQIERLHKTSDLKSDIRSIQIRF